MMKFFILTLIIVSSAIAAPPVCSTDICTVVNGAGLQINKFTGINVVFANASGKDIFIPTKTCNEYISLLAHPPAGLTHDYTIDPCICKTMGQAGYETTAICAGTFNTVKYMTTPGGCTDSSTPTCTGSDSIIKYWVGTTGSHVNVPGVENIPDTGAATASTQTGDVTTPLIAAHASVSSDSAADYCNDMVYGGYSDWYLPAKSELTYLFCNSNLAASRTAGNPQEQPNCAGAYNGPTALLTGFTSGYYNSSTEVDYSGDLDDAAWYHNFFNGPLQYNGKSNPARVRCIRKR